MTPKQIYRLRKRLGLKQAEFGKLVGVGESSVCLWESGERQPAKSAKLLLSNLLAAAEKESANDRKVVPRNRPRARVLGGGV